MAFGGFGLCCHAFPLFLGREIVRCLAGKITATSWHPRIILETRDRVGKRCEISKVLYYLTTSYVKALILILPLAAHYLDRTDVVDFSSPSCFSPCFLLIPAVAKLVPNCPNCCLLACSHTQSIPHNLTQPGVTTVVGKYPYLHIDESRLPSAQCSCFPD
ncbi:hypothetical protein P167DRAFT_541585 [Morchella conica CCBAS932]|uniref:Uncharacterized protein n=1 Tax=Morchella conica CCBAS932 TaxID=1392247 RepID=A0A3N4L862_9PEZI|nr:hypothetical protein P167DRAFT_541585 [Morchella conica CCBAS932]